jgi:uncharacterized protein YaaW (UPF0174 family)
MRHADLEFLSQCSNEDLDPIVRYLLKATTEMLSVEHAYKMHQGDHRRYLKEIKDEISKFGGNTLLNLKRGHGVDYAEIVRDVASKLGAEVYGDATAETEWSILATLLKRSLEKMSAEEREEAQRELEQLGLKGVNWRAGGAAALVAAQFAIRAGGFAAYRLALVIANGVAKAVLGQGLKLAANAGLARFIGIFAGPVGWIISGIWTAIDLAGPAYRLTIPCAVHIAMLRLKHQAGDLGECAC